MRELLRRQIDQVMDAAYTHHSDTSSQFAINSEKLDEVRRLVQMQYAHANIYAAERVGVADFLEKSVLHKPLLSEPFYRGLLRYNSEVLGTQVLLSHEKLSMLPFNPFIPIIWNNPDKSHDYNALLVIHDMMHFYCGSFAPFIVCRSGDAGLPKVIPTCTPQRYLRAMQDCETLATWANELVVPAIVGEDTFQAITGGPSWHHIFKKIGVSDVSEMHRWLSEVRGDLWMQRHKFELCLFAQVSTTPYKEHEVRGLTSLVNSVQRLGGDYLRRFEELINNRVQDIGLLLGHFKSLSETPHELQTLLDFCPQIINDEGTFYSSITNAFRGAVEFGNVDTIKHNSLATLANIDVPLRALHLRTSRSIPQRARNQATEELRELRRSFNSLSLRSTNPATQAEQSVLTNRAIEVLNRIPPIDLGFVPEVLMFSYPSEASRTVGRPDIDSMNLEILKKTATQLSALVTSLPPGQIVSHLTKFFDSFDISLKTILSPDKLTINGMRQISEYLHPRNYPKLFRETLARLINETKYFGEMNELGLITPLRDLAVNLKQRQLIWPFDASARGIAPLISHSDALIRGNESDRLAILSGIIALKLLPDGFHRSLINTILTHCGVSPESQIGPDHVVPLCLGLESVITSPSFPGYSIDKVLIGNFLRAHGIIGESETRCFKLIKKLSMLRTLGESLNLRIECIRGRNLPDALTAASNSITARMQAEGIVGLHSQSILLRGLRFKFQIELEVQREKAMRIISEEMLKQGELDRNTRRF